MIRSSRKGQACYLVPFPPGIGRPRNVQAAWLLHPLTSSHPAVGRYQRDYGVHESRVVDAHELGSFTAARASLDDEPLPGSTPGSGAASAVPSRSTRGGPGRGCARQAWAPSKSASAQGRVAVRGVELCDRANGQAAFGAAEDKDPGLRRRRGPWSSTPRRTGAGLQHHVHPGRDGEAADRRGGATDAQADRLRVARRVVEVVSAVTEPTRRSDPARASQRRREVRSAP